MTGSDNESQFLKSNVYANHETLIDLGRKAYVRTMHASRNPVCSSRLENGDPFSDPLRRNSRSPRGVVSSEDIFEKKKESLAKLGTRKLGEMRYFIVAAG